MKSALRQNGWFRLVYLTPLYSKFRKFGWRQLARQFVSRLPWIAQPDVRKVWYIRAPVLSGLGKIGPHFRLPAIVTLVEKILSRVLLLCIGLYVAPRDKPPNIAQARPPLGMERTDDGEPKRPRFMNGQKTYTFLGCGTYGF